MNKTFKTIWNDVRRSYVVTNETQKTHGKPSKSAVALAVAATAFLSAGVVNAAYVDPGQLGSTSSWETKEYGNATATAAGQHGLTHINASTAYAEGYTGKGVLIGVVDSGALLSHSELNDGRIFGVTASGTYYKTDTRYPFAYIGQTGGADNRTGEYQKGEAFETNGNWILGHNDSHGTHVTSVVAGNRNGDLSHGVAFDADVAVGNTGGTDNMNYGPYQDYNYFYAVWDAVGATGAKVINNSWGTNIRINDDRNQHFNVGDMVPDKDDGSNEPAYGEVVDLGGELQEYYLFMEDAEKNGGKNFMDAAYEVAAKYGLIQIFTNGNRQFQNPFYRASYAYFNPEAEKYWIAAGGVDVLADGTEQIMGWGKTYSGTGAAPEGGNTYNRAGIAKWWTITAPTKVLGASVSSSTGEATTGIAGGTSNAAPHIAGAMGVLLQRYGSYMDATQVRDVMFTTARQTQFNDPTENLPGISDSELGAPEDDYGWGIVDLGKAIYGPGQFLGTFDVTMNGVDDQWDNAITEKAIVLRGVEDANEKKELTPRIAELQAKAQLSDEERWELQYKEKRLAAIEEREAQGYHGKLIKRGNGVLTMTAVNDYAGGTEIYGGTVAGLTESFGSGDVTVKAEGTVELHKSFQVTHAGEEDWVTTTAVGTDATDDDANIVLDGGSLALADEGIKVNSLTVKSGTVKVGGIDETKLQEMFVDPEVEVKTSVEYGKAEGVENLVADSSYAFFETTLEEGENSLTATMSRNENAPQIYANSKVGTAVADVLAAAPESAIMTGMMLATKDQVRSTLDSLGSDIYLSAQNASIVNAMSVARAVKDQAIGVGEGRVVEMNDGTARLWATGMGAWSDVDYGTSMDVDTYAGFIGGEVDVLDNTKVGVFFGYGSTDFDADRYGKIESDDIHFGVYGETAFDMATLTYGVIHTNQDRDITRAITVMDQIGGANTNADATITQLYAEGAFTGLNTDAYAVEPYFGLSYMHVKTDGIDQSVAGMSFNTEVDSANLVVTTLGVRGAVPFSVGSVGMQVKGDVAWNHFFGDNEAEAVMQVADAGFAKVKGEKLDNMASVGLGVEAQITKNATLGVSYSGAFDGDITSHGVGANLRINF